MLRKDLSSSNFEVNRAFYQQWVVGEHICEVSTHELVLHVVATIVEARSPNITARTFEAVGLRLHLRVVFFIDGLGNRFQTGI